MTALERLRTLAPEGVEILGVADHGVWLTIDGGPPAHINGDPRMSRETLEAICEMARAARRAMRGTP